MKTLVETAIQSAIGDGKHEFAFDVKLWTCARVNAQSEAEARKILLDTLSCLDLQFANDDIQLTEASIEDDSGTESELFEIDGEAV